MAKMTITEANDVIARHVVVNARRDNTVVTIAIVEEAVRVFSDNPEHTICHRWAQLCNVRSTYRLAVSKLVNDGRSDLTIRRPTVAQRAFLRSVIAAGGSDVTDCPKARNLDTTVIACRENGWIAPHPDSAVCGIHLPGAPWTITCAGRDSVFDSGDYRR